MEVVTNNDRLLKYRQMIIELLFSERNHICAVCVANGHCELQEMAQRLGVTHIPFEYLNPEFELDGSHPQFEVDHNRCILCGRCVRVCDEIEGAHIRDLRHAAFRQRSSPILTHPGANLRDVPHAASVCMSAPPARWLKKENRLPKWRNAASSCLTW